MEFVASPHSRLPSLEFFPEDIVEKIILRAIPYPKVGQAKLLSKIWRNKFTPLSMLPVGQDVDRARSFQTEVSTQSQTWKTVLSPVICSRGERWLGFDNLSKQWRNLPAVTVLDDFRLNSVKIEGVLLYGEIQLRDTRFLGVVNVFTNQLALWPFLQIVASPRNTNIICYHLIPDGDSYTFLLIAQGNREEKHLDCMTAYVYDSGRHAWTVHDIQLPVYLCEESDSSQDNEGNAKDARGYEIKPDGYAYFRGSLFMTNYKVADLLVFEVTTRTVKIVKLGTDGVATILDEHFRLRAMSPCNNSLIMIGTNSDTDTVRVLEIDLVSKTLSPVKEFDASSHGDMLAIDVDMSKIECVFFLHDEEGRMVCHDESRSDWLYYECSRVEHKWSTSGAFYPRGNPFIDV